MQIWTGTLGLAIPLSNQLFNLVPVIMQNESKKVNITARPLQRP